MEATKKDRRDYDILLEKVIQITEDNLKSQSLYLVELTELQNGLDHKFENNLRDHTDIKRDVEFAVKNTFEILSRMTASSNEKIIQLLEMAEDKDVLHRHQIEKIDQITSSFNDKMSSLNILNINIEEIKKNTEKTADSFDLVKKILTIIAIITIGANVMFGVWKGIKDSYMEDDFKKIIREEIRKR